MKKLFIFLLLLSTQIIKPQMVNLSINYYLKIGKFDGETIRLSINKSACDLRSITRILNEQLKSKKIINNDQEFLFAIKERAIAAGKIIYSLDNIAIGETLYLDARIITEEDKKEKRENELVEKILKQFDPNQKSFCIIQ